MENLFDKFTACFYFCIALLVLLSEHRSSLMLPTGKSRYGGE